MTAIVDYNELWRLLRQRSGGHAVDWTTRCLLPPGGCGASAEVKAESVPSASPDDTVLDMGAGTLVCSPDGPAGRSRHRS